MQCCFFEDDKGTNFNPLTLTRPVDDLRTGILTLGEKWQVALGNINWSRCIREELRSVFFNRITDKNVPCFWINSRFFPSGELIDEMKNLQTGYLLTSNETVVAAKVDGATSMKWQKAGKPEFKALKPAGSVQAKCITYLWDLFLMNADEITADLERLNYPSSINSHISKNAVLEHEENIFIGEGAEIQAGAILNAKNGPVYIGKNATVSAGAIIEGPVAVCEQSAIKPGSKIHANTTVGPVSKVGGEVSNSIFHSYSNKAHDGYLGSSLVGQWCNFGAGTNNSNLKNNYSNIRLTDWNSKETIETGQQFLGLIMGDHSKTAIGTRLNTGTMCGVSCNIFCDGFSPKYIPSFSWVRSNGIQTYNLGKALETMRVVMARRKVDLSDDYKELMETIIKNR